MSKSILIVDDIELSLEIIEHAASQCLPISRINKAKNAYEAINKIRTRSYDLIIMDIMMPNGNGLELLDMLAFHKVESRIVILSALDKSVLDSIKIVAKLYELNVVAMLEKPVVSVELANILNKELSCEVDNKKTIVEIISDEDECLPVKLFYQAKINTISNFYNSFELKPKWKTKDDCLLSSNYYLPCINKFYHYKPLSLFILIEFGTF